MHTTPTIRAGGATPPAAPMPTPRLRSKDRVWTAEQFMAEALRDPGQVARLAKGGLRLEASPLAMDTIRASDLGRYVGEDGTIEPPQTDASVELGVA